MHQPLAKAATATFVPPLIKRNTALFALSQSFTGCGMSMAYGLGPLMVVALTQSASLAGLSVALLGLSRFLISYPLGKITDTYGRKPGILLGLGLAIIGTVIVGSSMALGSIAVFITGMLVFGMGMNGAQQLRVAATDMFPPNMRATALGYVALGSLVGLAVGPPMVSIAEALSRRLGQDPLGLPWLMLPLLIISGMVVVYFVRPDPKEIGMNLQRYFPDYVPRPRPPEDVGRPFSVWRLLSNRPVLLAIVSNSAATGNMAIVMVLTSLVLHHHGYSLTAIAFSHMFHSMGMFAFTVPIGKLADRIGRPWVMFPGVAIALFGAILVTFTPTYLLVTLGSFLVGLGWAGANVAATALIADQYETVERGRAIGVNDSAAGAISVAMAVVTGPMIDWYGLPAAGVIAILLAIVPLAMLAMNRRRLS